MFKHTEENSNILENEEGTSIDMAFYDYVTYKNALGTVKIENRPSLTKRPEFCLNFFLPKSLCYEGTAEPMSKEHLSRLKEDLKQATKIFYYGTVRFFTIGSIRHKLYLRNEAQREKIQSAKEAQYIKDKGEVRGFSLLSYRKATNGKAEVENIDNRFLEYRPGDGRVLSLRFTSTLLRQVMALSYVLLVRPLVWDSPNEAKTLTQKEERELKEHVSAFFELTGSKTYFEERAPEVATAKLPQGEVLQ